VAARLGNLLLTGCLFYLTACSGSGPPASGSSDSDAVTLLVFGEPEELAAYRELVSAYEATDDEARVTIIEASDRDDLLTRMSTSFAGGEPPDLFLINYRFFGQFAARDVLEPLGPHLDASTKLKLDEFFPQAVDAFRFGGELMCLPQNISSLVVYYNRGLFAAAGVAQPSDGWTWDEMVLAATALTDVPNDQHGLGVEPTLIRLAPFVWSNGGELFDDPENPTAFALDSPQTLDAMQDFLDLGTFNSPIPSDEAVEAEDVESRFLNGRLAMLLSSRRSTPTFRTITNLDWDIAPLPVHAEPAGILHADAYCMTRASESKDAAWRFVEFALDSEGQKIMAASGRTVPSLIEVAESASFLDPDAKPANSRVFLDTIPYIRRVPNISTWPEIEDAAEPILELALYGGVSAERVAQQIEDATANLFARAEN
jgi:multiple sugar transport system substrate-binding protein